MKILYDNLLDDATLTESSEDGNYPAEYVQDQDLAATWRTTGDTSENIVIDLGAAASVDCAAIFGHNLTASATIKIQGHTADSWASPDVDETITAATYGLMHFFTSASKRYWRFTFADASNPDGYIEIGRLMVGANLTITKSFTRSFTEKNVDTSERYFAQGGQVRGVKGYRRREYSLSFPYWTSSMLDDIKTMIDTVYKSMPIAVALDEDNMDDLNPLYCVIDGDMSAGHIYNYKFTGQLDFREVF